MVKRISKNKKSQKKRSQARKQNRKVSTTQSRRRSRKVSMTRSRRRSRKVSNKKKRSSKRSRKVVKKISKRQRRSRRRSRKQKQRGGAEVLGLAIRPWTPSESKRWSESTEQEKRDELRRLKTTITMNADEQDIIAEQISHINASLPSDAGESELSKSSAAIPFDSDGNLEDLTKKAVGAVGDTPADHSSKRPRKALTSPPNLDRANRKRLTQKGDKNVTKSADATVRAKTIASRSVDPQECFYIKRGEDGNSVEVTRV